MKPSTPVVDTSAGSGSAAVESLLEARISAFLGMLETWNSRINLVAERDADAIRHRHVADSLQLLPLLPPGSCPVGDLGTGAGFPGLILAFATSRMMHLIESDRRKAAFLTHVAGRLGLENVQIHARRIEATSLPPLAAVTARALAPLQVLLPHAARLLAPDGVAVFLKGRGAGAEVTAARVDWYFQLERLPSRTDPEASILRLSEIRRAGPDA